MSLPTQLAAVNEKILNSPEEVEEHWKFLSDWAIVANHELEGMMLHQLTKAFNPGKRCWGMQRYKPQPVGTFEVIEYQEAISKDGEPLGMVGGITVAVPRRISGKVVLTGSGVGPGRMTHHEREAVWRDAAHDPQSAAHARFPRRKTLIDVKYMPDSSYDQLRQATFQCFRDDKDEPDVLG